MSIMARDETTSETEDVTDQTQTGSVMAKMLPTLSVNAFLLDADNATALREAADDRRLKRSKWRFFEGGIPAATEHLKDAVSPNLLILETRDSVAAILEQLNALADHCHMDTKVIILEPENDMGLFRELSRNGVSDVLLSPTNPVEMMRAIERIFDAESQPRLGRSTAFIGARGGVGSSTLAQNVAHVMSGTIDTQVVMTEMDMHFGTVGLNFDIETNRGMDEIIENASRLDDTLLDRLAHDYNDNLKILAAQPGFEGKGDLAGAVDKMLDLAQTSARHIVMDLPTTWGEHVRMALKQADEVVLTVSPDLKSLRNARFIIDALRRDRRNDAPPILVFNKIAMAKGYEIDIKEITRVLDLTEQAVIPYDGPFFGQATNEGMIATRKDSKGSFAIQCKELAEVINGQKSRKSQSAVKRGIFRRLLGRR